MKLINAVQEKANPVKTLVKSKQSVEFKIGDSGKIIEILRSKIYSNPIQTMVQEYLANARDAMRENGSTKRIQVALPTAANPVLSIRDFGPGIDKNRMLNFFTQYGNSTKGETNSQTGGFGLGSKLAWAYTDTFMINTFVDGVETNYAAMIGAVKSGTLELLSEGKTLEANGTEIRIPIAATDFAAISNAAKRAVFYWNANERPEFTGDFHFEFPTPVNVCSGVDLYSKLDVVGMFDSNWGGSVVIAIDGTPYELSSSFVDESDSTDKLRHKIANKSAIVFHVGNGVVEVAANRETISENERTLKVIKNKLQDVYAGFKKYSDSMLNTPTKLLEVEANLKTVADYLNISETKFTNGKEVINLSLNNNNGWYNRSHASDCVTVSSERISKLELDSFTRGNYGEIKPERKKRWAKFRLDAILVIADESISKAKQTQKVKMAMGSDSRAILIHKGSESSEYLNSLVETMGAYKLSDFDLPKPVRKEREILDAGLVKVQVVDLNGYGRKSTQERVIDLELNTSKYVYFVREEGKELDSYKSLEKFLDTVNTTLIVVTNRVAKSLNGREHFTDLSEFMANTEKVLGKVAYKKLLVDAQRSLLSDSVSNLESIYTNESLLSKVKDPELKAHLELVNEFSDYATTGMREGDALLTHLAATVPEVKKALDVSLALPKLIKDKYGLVNVLEYSVNKEIAPDVVHYLNGAFEGSK